MVTIGTFDGVHLGHQKVIKRVRQLADDCHGEVVVLTFFPHPRMIINPGNHGIRLLNTLDEKCELLEKAGVDHLIIHPFSQEFSNHTPEDFVSNVLVNSLGVYKLVIGYDHRFGKDRSGSFDDLIRFAPNYGFEVEKIPEEDVNDIAVSSTRIRNCLQNGEVDEAKQLLGVPYRLSGKVIHGQKLGRELGFPTANLDLENYKLIPEEGVYIGNVYIDGKFHEGLVSIGTRPTINDEGKLSVEVFIMNFDKDLYDRPLKVDLLHRIRPNVKFDNVEQLVDRMKADQKIAEEYFVENR